MPELPEVESARRLVEKYLLHSPIKSISLKEEGNGPRHGLFDEIVFSNTPGEEITSFLMGDQEKSKNKGSSNSTTNNRRQILSASRKGKQLYFEIGDCNTSKPSTIGYLLVHFGMTGSFVIEGLQVPTYISVKIDESTFPPKYCKLLIEFENGKRLAFVDPRRIGRIQCSYQQNSLLEPSLASLAPDPIVDGINVTDVVQRLSLSSQPIKVVLLDQEKIICGIGNYLADEILYQSGVHPNSCANKIPTDIITTLCHTMEEILKIACDLTEKMEDFPDDWLFHYRWGKGKGRGDGSNKMPNGNKISFDKIGGRTTAYVEDTQVLYGQREVKVKAKSKSIKPISSKEIKVKAKSGKNKKSTDGDEDDETEVLQVSKKPRKVK